LSGYSSSVSGFSGYSGYSGFSGLSGYGGTSGYPGSGFSGYSGGYWTRDVGGFIYPTNTGDRVLVGTSSDDGAYALQVSGNATVFGAGVCLNLVGVSDSVRYAGLQFSDNTDNQNWSIQFRTSDDSLTYAYFNGTTASDLITFDTSGNINMLSSAQLVFGADTTLSRQSVNSQNVLALDLPNSANGQLLGFGVLSESLVVPYPSAATVNQLPANAVILGVSVRCTSTGPGMTLTTVKGTTSTTQFNTTSINASAGNTDPGTKSCPYYNSTAQTLTLVVTGLSANSTWRVTIHYYVIQPATS